MRTIAFESEINDGIIRLPEKYKNLGKNKIEVFLIVKYPQPEKNDVTRSARGILSKYKNPALIHKEKSAWEAVIKGKHGSY